MRMQRCKNFLVLQVRKAIAALEESNRLYNEIYDNSDHHGTPNMITTFSCQHTELEESLDKILLPPTDTNAEVQEIPGYKIVYVNGACPRNYRVYKGDSMIGVIFQHITHWCNEVDSLRYAKALDAAFELNEFLKVARISTTATEQPVTEEELLDKEFDALTFDDWERLKRYVPETRDLIAA